MIQTRLLLLYLPIIRSLVCALSFLRAHAPLSERLALLLLDAVANLQQQSALPLIELDDAIKLLHRRGVCVRVEALQRRGDFL